MKEADRKLREQEVATNTMIFGRSVSHRKLVTLATDLLWKSQLHRQALSDYAEIVQAIVPPGWQAARHAIEILAALRQKRKFASFDWMAQPDKPGSATIEGAATVHPPKYGPR